MRFLRALVTRQFSKKSHHHRKQKIARVAVALVMGTTGFLDLFMTSQLQIPYCVRCHWPGPGLGLAHYVAIRAGKLSKHMALKKACPPHKLMREILS